MLKQKIIMHYPGLFLFPKVHRRSSILIISLWLIFLLAFFTVVIAGIIRQKLIVANRIDKGFKAYAAALAAIEAAKAVVGQSDEGNRLTNLYRWYNDERIFKDKHLGEAFYNVAYTTDTGASATKTVYGLIDEERKINLNKAPQEVLFRLFSQEGIVEAKQIAACVIDWRDKDSQITDAGAENTYYNSLKDPYSARNADLKSIYELLLVNGMTKKDFDVIKEYVTVYGGGAVNVNTASKEVLAALGFGPSLIAKIIEYRNGPDGELFTADDRMFENASSIPAVLQAFTKLSPDEESQLQDALKSNTLGIEAAYFEVKAFGSTTGKQETAYVDCIISKTGKVLFWHEQ